LAENFVKATTGGDKISARYLYQEYFEFEAIFKLWLGTNHKPVVKGVDEGIWRRIRLVPFSERFEGDRRDEELRQKLEEELPGILAWAIQGCQEWQQLGLKPSQSVSDATKTYRTEMDSFAAFLEEQCSVTEGARAKASDLYQSYRSWAEANGEKPVSQRWFGLRLSERGFVKKSVDGYPHYQGLGLSRKFSAGENDA
jgi:putative DNA primase/helicase